MNHTNMTHKRRVHFLAWTYLLPCLGLLGAVSPAHAQVFKFEEVLNGTAGSWQFFPFQLPAGATFLNAELSGGSGDADLYVRPGEQPTETEFTCRPWLDSNDETCDTQAPQAGTWFVGINGFDDFADVTLKVTWSAAVPMEPPAMEPPAMEPPAMEPPAGNLADWQQQMLDQHNVLRARHCAPAQTWDAELAASAQAWAEQCVFEHSAGPWGENLSAGTTQTGVDAVDSWYSELPLYNFAEPGHVPGAGHFTQLVWRDSIRLGCGKARCPNIFPDFGGADFYVCRYAPPGNVVSPGQFEANVLAAPADGVCQ